MPIDRAISAAADDIADALNSGRRSARRNNMRSYLEAALWAAASSAEELPGNAWIDPRAVDSWLRSAAEGVAERFQLPDTLTDKQFRDISERLGIGVDALEKMIPTRIKLEPDMKAEIDAILGTPGMPKAPADLPAMDAPKAPSPPLPSKPRPTGPDYYDKPGDGDDKAKLGQPTPRPEVERSDVKAPDDEFEGDITKNRNLPGAPKL